MAGGIRIALRRRRGDAERTARVDPGSGSGCLESYQVREHRKRRDRRDDEDDEADRRAGFEGGRCTGGDEHERQKGSAHLSHR